MSYLKSPLVVYRGIISYLKSSLVVYRRIMSYLKSPLVVINVREYQRGNQKWTILRIWLHRVHKTKTKNTQKNHNTLCVAHHYTQINTNNVNK
jgi:hypothetical protein